MCVCGGGDNVKKLMCQGCVCVESERASEGRNESQITSNVFLISFPSSVILHFFPSCVPFISSSV